MQFKGGQMKAEEMFKKLNFKENKDNAHLLSYIFDGEDMFMEIRYCKRTNEIQIYQKTKYGYDSVYLTDDKLKAIIMQAKELGWLDE